MATWCEQLTHLKRPWCWERLKAGGEGDDKGWDGWIASLNQWTWVRVNSRSWWWTGKPGVRRSMGLQRVGHTWATELTDWLTQWTVWANSRRYWRTGKPGGVYFMLSSFSRVQLFPTAWIIVCQPSLAMGFSRQEYWSGLPCPPLGAPPNAGTEPMSPAVPALQAESLPLSYQQKPHMVS